MKLADTALDLIGRLPTTNARIAVTLLCMLATATVYLASRNWEPSWEWLAFLVTMAGVDVAQFAAKRMTHKPDATDNPPAPPAP
jgi:sterol desaturase/sphingolipid hydroxylase (fatty acid hydroxylase superfamily)